LKYRYKFTLFKIQIGTVWGQGLTLLCARVGAAAWKDINGNFWFFGGEYGSRKNDLWKYTP